MKITLKLTTLIFCFFSVLNLAQEKQAEIKFETNSIDYGQIDYDSDGTRVFKFKNVGEAPLVFTRISSSCGCTIPKKPEKPILPGESEKIQVKYDTKRVGFIRKSITVTSNAASSPTTILKIKGQVVENNQQIGIERKKKSIVEVY